MTWKRICPICNKEVRMPTKRRPATNYTIQAGTTIHKVCRTMDKKKIAQDTILTDASDILKAARRCTCNGSHGYKCVNTFKPYRLKRGEVRVYVPGDSAEYVLQTVPRATEPLYGGYGALEVVDIEDDQPAVDERKPADDTFSILGIDTNEILHFFIVVLATSIAITSHEGRYVFASIVIVLMTFLVWEDYVSKKKNK